MLINSGASSALASKSTMMSCLTNFTPEELECYYASFKLKEAGDYSSLKEEDITTCFPACVDYVVDGNGLPVFEKSLLEGLVVEDKGFGCITYDSEAPAAVVNTRVRRSVRAPFYLKEFVSGKPKTATQSRCITIEKHVFKNNAKKEYRMVRNKFYRRVMVPVNKDLS